MVRTVKGKDYKLRFLPKPPPSVELPRFPPKDRNIHHILGSVMSKFCRNFPIFLCHSNVGWKVTSVKFNVNTAKFVSGMFVTILSSDYQLCVRISLFSRKLVPLHRNFIILWNTKAMSVHMTYFVLNGRFSLFRKWSPFTHSSCVFTTIVGIQALFGNHHSHLPLRFQKAKQPLDTVFW